MRLEINAVICGNDNKIENIDLRIKVDAMIDKKLSQLEKIIKTKLTSELLPYVTDTGQVIPVSVIIEDPDLSITKDFVID